MNNAYVEMLALLRAIQQWALDSGVLMHGGREADLFGKVSDVIHDADNAYEPPEPPGFEGGFADKSLKVD